MRIVPGFWSRVAFRLTRPVILYALMMLLGAVWGLQYALAKLVAVSGIPVVGALFTVHDILAVVFLAYLMIRRRGFALTWSRVLFFAAVAAFGTVGELGFELLVAEHVTASELTLIISLMPVFVLLLAVVFRSENLSLRKFAGLALGGMSAMAILLPGVFGESTSDGSWIVVAFLVPLSAAIALVLMAKYWPRGLDPVQVTAGILVAGTMMLAPLTMWSGDEVGFNASWESSDWALLGFTVVLAADYYIMALLARLSGAIFTSCSDYVAICAGLAWGYVIFAEIPDLWVIAAALFCVGALKIAAGGTDVDVEVAKPV